MVLTIDWGDGFGRNIKLDAISIAVEVETMFTKYISKRENVKDEELRTQKLTLGKTLGQRSDGSLVIFRRAVSGPCC